MTVASVKGQLVTEDENGKKITQNFDRMSPDATEEQVGTVFNALAGLQRNTVLEAYRIVSTPIDVSV